MVSPTAIRVGPTPAAPAAARAAAAVTSLTAAVPADVPVFGGRSMGVGRRVPARSNGLPLRQTKEWEGWSVAKASTVTITLGAADDVDLGYVEGEEGDVGEAISVCCC